MRNLPIISLFGLLISILLSPTSKLSPPIRWDELRQRGVIGKLGLPLGTGARIEATVFAGRELNMKAFDGEYLLRVTHVNNRPLKEPTLIEFEVDSHSNLEMPHDEMALFRWKTGKVSGFGSDEIATLEKGYVGRSVRLLVYETGRFSGLPNIPPEFVTPGTAQAAGVGFGFSTRLEIMTVDQKK